MVLLDLNMPGMDGLQACARLRVMRSPPAPEVLMLTVSEEEPDLYAALRVGAAGDLTKNVPPAELIEAVLAVAHGEPRIAPRDGKPHAGRDGARDPTAGGPGRAAQRP